MPRPRDQRLYFELQGKLTQQEVDYNNMHQHHTIVRAPQGKVTKISNDQYHDSMDIDEIEPVAGQRAVVAQEFQPKEEQPPSRKASEPKKNGDDPIPSKSATQIRTNNLPTVPTEPPRVVSTNQAEAAKEALKRNAPNQNKYVVNIADRVKRRRDRKKPDRLGFLDDRIKATQRHGTKTKGDSGETRRAKSAKAKTSAREAKFEQQRKKSNVTMLPYRKRKQNPGVKAPKPMQY